MKTIVLSIVNVIHSITLGDVAIAIVFVAVFLGLGHIVKEFLTKEPQKRKQTIN